MLNLKISALINWTSVGQISLPVIIFKVIQDFPHLLKKANVSAKRQFMKASFDAQAGPHQLPLKCSFRASLKRSFPAHHLGKIRFSCINFKGTKLRARLHGEFHPGLKFQTGFWNKSSENQVVDYMERDSAPAENPSPVFSNRAKIFSPAKRAEKSM